MTKEPSDYLCPLCDVKLSTQIGDYFHPNDISYGMSLYCNNPHCLVEVHGFTRNNKPSEAFDIIEDKYTAHMINKNE
jgi:hypothetical protein